jgi:DNA-binding NarL/FixJ family response regulator
MCGLFESLSPREKEVLALVAGGLTDGAISKVLEPCVSEETVGAHLRRIFQKLQVNSGAQATAIYVRHQPPPHDDTTSDDAAEG